MIRMIIPQNRSYIETVTSQSDGLPIIAWVGIVLGALFIVAIIVIACIDEVGLLTRLRRARRRMTDPIKMSSIAIRPESDEITLINPAYRKSWKSNSGKYFFRYYWIERGSMTYNIGCLFRLGTDPEPSLCVNKPEWWTLDMQDVLTVYKVISEDFPELKLKTVVDNLWNFKVPVDPKSLLKYDLPREYWMYNLGLTLSKTQEVFKGASKGRLTARLTWGDFGEFKIESTYEDLGLENSLGLSDYNIEMRQIRILETSIIKPKMYDTLERYWFAKFQEEKTTKTDSYSHSSPKIYSPNIDDVVTVRI